MLLIDETDTQTALAAYLRNLRKLQGYSREKLAEISTVPAPTIKKFETTGQISLRQFLLLWQSLDDLQKLYALTQKSVIQEHPKTIEDVLNAEF
ncbi:helix-turn-helix domain-containing protein [Neisseria weixii]|nr:helix-turn-helix domain-containing protein [Neisseria weixii]